MAIMRSMSQLNIKAPPPSPIPTATGSRSSSNETLTDFLEKTLQVPNLLLPESQDRHHLSITPDDQIDFRFLAAREAGSVKRMLQSARQVGAFRVGCGGGIISKEEMEALVKEAEKVFGVLEERDTGFRRYFAGKREEIVWVRCRDERMEWARQYIGAHLYHSFSEKLEKVGSKLDKLGEELGQILVENASNMQQRKGLQRGESLLSIYKYNQEEDEITEPKTSLLNEKEKEVLENDHTLLSLHLPTKHCKFCVKYGPSRLLTFDAGPQTIIVTVGQQLEECSLGEFKHVSGRIIYQPELRESQSYNFSMELKWSSLNTNRSYRTSYEKISLADQFLIALVLVFLYSIFMFKSSP